LKPTVTGVDPGVDDMSAGRLGGAMKADTVPWVALTWLVRKLVKSAPAVAFDCSVK
jgi:hypothetical protein